MVSVPCAMKSKRGRYDSPSASFGIGRTLTPKTAVGTIVFDTSTLAIES